MAPGTAVAIDYSEWISSAYNANPASLSQWSGDVPVPPQSVVSFHDKHLDQSLVLRNVKSLSSLLVDFSDVATELTQRTSDLAFPLAEVGHCFLTKPTYNPVIRDAMDVGRHYTGYVSTPCCNLASTLVFHPTCPEWTSVICWDYKPTYHRHKFYVDEFSLRICRTEETPYELDLPCAVQDFLDDETKEELLRLTVASPDLITGQIYAVTEEAEDLVKRLLLASLSRFNWIMPSTMGQELNPSSTSGKTRVDADILSSVKEEVRRSRLHMNKQARRLPKASSRVIPPSRIGLKRGRSYDARPDPRQYLQHAWAQSVAQNTTFILFHCGNYDRIGVRHRETQTLYLSDLVDVKNCKDPAYSKLQVGLYIASIQDAKERLAKESPDAESANTGEKRRLSSESKHPNKRRRTNVHHPQKECDESDEFFVHEVSRRDLALVRLQYGIYNSPVPASFLRCGPSILWGETAVPFKDPKRKAGYNPTEYFSLTLGTEMDKGAVGIIHRGTLSLQTRHGTTLTRDVVAKLAFPSESQEGLEREMSAYAHLSRTKNVKGLLPVYGLFRDMEGGPLMLILPFGGVSLFDRGVEQPGDRVTVSESERKAFYNALRSIHDGGVRHRDIRTPNMLVNGPDVYFIDFDQALLRSPSEGRGEEMADLQDLIGAEPEDSRS